MFRFFVLFLVLISVSSCSDELVFFEENDPLIIKALSVIKAEPQVQDAVYDPSAYMFWYVGVSDNGQTRHGYADYICQSLSEYDLVTHDTYVRINDMNKINQGVGFRDSSLGTVKCSDASRSMP